MVSYCCRLALLVFCGVTCFADIPADDRQAWRDMILDLADRAEATCFFRDGESFSLALQLPEIKQDIRVDLENGVESRVATNMVYLLDGEQKLVSHRSGKVVAQIDDWIRGSLASTNSFKWVDYSILGDDLSNLRNSEWASINSGTTWNWCVVSGIPTNGSSWIYGWVPMTNRTSSLPYLNLERAWSNALLERIRTGYSVTTSTQSRVVYGWETGELSKYWSSNNSSAVTFTNVTTNHVYGYFFTSCPTVSVFRQEIAQAIIKQADGSYSETTHTNGSNVIRIVQRGLDLNITKLRPVSANYLPERLHNNQRNRIIITVPGSNNSPLSVSLSVTGIMHSTSTSNSPWYAGLVITQGASFATSSSYTGPDGGIWSHGKPNAFFDAQFFSEWTGSEELEYVNGVLDEDDYSSVGTVISLVYECDNFYTLGSAGFTRLDNRAWHDRSRVIEQLKWLEGGIENLSYKNTTFTNAAFSNAYNEFSWIGSSLPGEPQDYFETNTGYNTMFSESFCSRLASLSQYLYVTVQPGVTASVLDGFEWSKNGLLRCHDGVEEHSGFYDYTYEENGLRLWGGFEREWRNSFAGAEMGGLWPGQIYLSITNKTTNLYGTVSVVGKLTRKNDEPWFYWASLVGTGTGTLVKKTIDNADLWMSGGICNLDGTTLASKLRYFPKFPVTGTLAPPDPFTDGPNTINGINIFGIETNGCSRGSITAACETDWSGFPEDYIYSHWINLFYPTNTGPVYTSTVEEDGLPTENLGYLAELEWFFIPDPLQVQSNLVTLGVGDFVAVGNTPYSDSASCSHPAGMGQYMFTRAGTVSYIPNANRRLNSPRLVYQWAFEDRIKDHID